MYKVIWGVTPTVREFEKWEDAEAWMKILKDTFKEFPHDYPAGTVAFAIQFKGDLSVWSMVHTYEAA